MLRRIVSALFILRCSLFRGPDHLAADGSVRPPAGDLALVHLSVGGHVHLDYAGLVGHGHRPEKNSPKGQPGGCLQSPVPVGHPGLLYPVFSL